ncbi:hypothetical protein C2G38_2151392 [Gigaspora rosea]|uniref:C2H2-type domain-containing protein n=1 Tax=Gigaspora rosea TaxID=44941 RepID=A0A397WCZ1_9GLOM|nr:hypothetical protein C2G38_2151392 [Gigaspora rosea]
MAKKCYLSYHEIDRFKNHAGLQRHETSKHSTYNLLPNHIQQIPESELCHLKDAIIKELQKRLKNHHRAVGKQVFSLHCSENAFVGLFGAYITRYSLCGSFYICSFKGENAIEIIESIFNNNWYKRNYGNGQLSFVRLYIPEEQDISKIDNKKQCSNKNSKPKKYKSKLFPNNKMIIEWRITGFKDKANYEYRAGMLQIRFFLD